MDLISTAKVLLDEIPETVGAVTQTASAISGNVIAYIGAALCAID